VPTITRASAGIAERLISSKIRLPPLIASRENHDDVMKASTNE
jgi:hypothetical protein